MYLGILIGMAIFGLLLMYANWQDAHHDNEATRVTQIGLGFFLVGFFGTLGILIGV